MFSSLHLMELQWIKSLQTLSSPLLYTLMLAFASLDSMPFYVLLITVVCFAYDQKIGFRFLILAILSWFLNQECKLFFQEPRPLHLDPSLGMVQTGSFGFPSGAAQSFVVYLGFLCLVFKKKWLWLVSIALTLLVSFSRVYLGLHFVSDIIGGWILGGILLSFYLYAQPKTEAFLAKRPKKLSVLFSLGAFAILFLLALNTKTRLIAWGFLGTTLGCIFAPSLSSKALSWKQRILRPLLALAGLILLVGLHRFVHITWPIVEPVNALACNLWFTCGASFCNKKWLS